MKIKITPLNIVTAFCLVGAVWLLTSKTERPSGHQDISATLAVLGVFAALVAFVSDQIFRRFIVSSPRLWVIESIFIILIIVVIFIIKSIIS